MNGLDLLYKDRLKKCGGNVETLIEDIEDEIEKLYNSDLDSLPIEEVRKLQGSVAELKSQYEHAKSERLIISKTVKTK